MDLIIKAGRIITAENDYQADIGIKDGKIVMIAGEIKADAKQIINAAGKYVLPGAIDAHVHLEMPIGGTMTADDYQSGTEAAACGGVTTVFDFVNQKSGQPLLDTIKSKQKSADEKAVIDYGFHFAITDLAATSFKELEAVADYGIANFKTFMAYKKAGLMSDDGSLAEILKVAKKLGVLVSVHAENNDLIEQRTERFLANGQTSPWYHYLSRPGFVEVEAVKRIIHLAKSISAPLYIVHLASGEGLEEVKKARREGYPIYAETCPQYLAFTKEVYRREAGQNFVCSPPIKGQDSQDALWQGIKDGSISVVATDHCPVQSYEKDWGQKDFTKIPNGCMGVENIYPYLLSKANQGIISFSRVVELVAKNPAKLLGCDYKKGSIAPGYDADLVIYDPQKKFTISRDKMHSNSDYTIWEGVELKGYPETTIAKGKVVYHDGEFLGEQGAGEFISCKK